MTVAKTLRAILLGSPVDPAHQPDAFELYQKLMEIETQAALNGALYFEDTLADLNAVSGAAEGDTGFVLDDATSANDGIYRRGVSTWAKTAALPDFLTDAGGALAAVALEEARALAAEGILQNNIDAEKNRALAAESALDVRLDALEAPGNVDTADLAGNAVTNAKLATMAAATIKGRAAGAGTGDPQDLTASQARTAMGLGTAATTDASAYATAAQGALADAAVQPGDDVSALVETPVAKIMTAAERTKLAGIADAATANASDAALRDRATHTGTQAISTVTGLQTALDGKATAAQGTKADSAVQPGADVSVLVETATAKILTAAERTKLAGIEAGAQVNTVASVAGKTGAVTLAKGDVGLGNVDNTADLAKPVSTAVQAALDAAAAERRTTVGLYVHPDQTLTQDIFARKTDGALVSNSSFHTRTVPVTPGQVYEIDVVVSGGSTAAAVFVTSGGALVSAFQDTLGTYTGLRVTVPATAATMYVSQADASTPPIAIRRIDALDPKAMLLATRGTDAIPVAVTATEVARVEAHIARITGQFCRYDTGVMSSVAGYDTDTYDVAGLRRILISGTFAGASIALAVFFDADGTYLGFAERQTGTPATYEDFEVAVPLGAETVKVSYQTSVGAPVVKPCRINTDLGAEAEASRMALHYWADLTGTVTDGSYVHYLTGVPTVSSGFSYATFALAGLSRVRVTATTTGNVVALAVFRDAGGTYLGYHLKQTSGVTNVYTDEVIDLPAGTATIDVTYTTASGAATAQGQAFNADAGEQLAKARRDVATIKGPWDGASVVWFGTSIPAGGGAAGNYPARIAEALGCTIYNEAVPGSTVRAGVASQITGSDPYGWTGENWVQVTKALCGTLTEKAALYADWATWQPLLTGSPPATVTVGDLAQWQDYSYEKRLIERHLGANRRDVYVFDHGVNDLGMASDVDSAGAGTRDRFTFLGGMNFLIDQILADNPKARIILIGHYENALRPTLVTAQDAVAALWDYPYLRLSDRLGWSQQTIQTTGAWVSGVWDPDYHVSPQSMTLLNRWLPDGLHPHSDLSGEANDRVAAVLTAMLLGVR